MTESGGRPQADLTIPPDYVAAARAAFQQDGIPLLRSRQPSDAYTVYARADDTGRYDLSLREEDEAVGQLGTWGDVADYLLLPFQEMVQALRACDYPEGCTPETPNDHVPNPYDPIEELAHLRPWRDLTDLLEGVPAVLETRDADAMAEIGEVRVERVSSRPGEDRLEISVDSAIALSALQLLMDRLDRGVHIQLWQDSEPPKAC